MGAALTLANTPTSVSKSGAQAAQASQIALDTLAAAVRLASRSSVPGCLWSPARMPPRSAPLRIRSFLPHGQPRRSSYNEPCNKGPASATATCSTNRRHISLVALDEPTDSSRNINRR